MEIASLAQRPDLLDVLPFGPGWPKFIFHDAVAARLMPTVERLFADFNLLMLDADDVVIAGGWGVPIAWDGTVDDLPDGWDGALERAVAGHKAGIRPDTLCAMATEVIATHRGTGLSAQVLVALRSCAAERGLDRMIAPARPTLKHRYPLTPIERYATWRRDDGALFDPWLRTHCRAGAEVLTYGHQAMVIEGSVSDWEEWTGMDFPETGEYIVPEALAPLRVDRERDIARYVEPAVWMLHGANPSP